MKGEDVLMVGAAPITEPEGGVLDEFGTALLTRPLKSYCRFFDVSFRELFRTLEMQGISVQVDRLVVRNQRFLF